MHIQHILIFPMWFLDYVICLINSHDFAFSEKNEVKRKDSIYFYQRRCSYKLVDSLEKSQGFVKGEELCLNPYFVGLL